MSEMTDFAADYKKCSNIKALKAILYGLNVPDTM